MSRRALGFLLLVIALAGAVVAVTVLVGPASRVRAPSVRELAPEARTAADLARAACVRLGLAAQVIRADGAAETVRTELAAARTLAAAAVRREARFASLSGGIAALDEAVRHDDADAAGVGLRVALEQCEADATQSAENSTTS